MLSLLSALSHAGRFGLTLKLMGSSAKASVDSLFQQLQGAMDAASAASVPGEVPQMMDASEFARLRIAYGLK